MRTACCSHRRHLGQQTSRVALTRTWHPLPRLDARGHRVSRPHMVMSVSKPILSQRCRREIQLNEGCSKMSCFVRVRKVKSLSLVQLFVTPWTVAYKAPPSMGFPRQEYWSGLPSPSAGDLPDPGIERGSPAVQADALTSEPPGKSSFYQNEGKYPCLRVDPQLQEKTLLVRLFEVTSRPWTPTSLAPVGWSVCVCVCLVTQLYPSLQPHGL